MKDFKHTATTLVKAYNRGSLKAAACHSCAVGNIVHSCNHGGSYTNWVYLFGTDYVKKRQRIDKSYEHNELVQQEIQSTGYTWQDLAKIEYAFECAAQGNDTLCAGLNAAIDVLAQIHDASPLEVEQVKQLIHDKNKSQQITLQL